MTVRPTRPDDLGAIAGIYAHYVLHSVATFELTPPDDASWRKRLADCRDAALPFLTALRSGSVAGYAYCVPWKARPAYRHTVENSVYLAADAVGLGIGGRLLDELLAHCVDADVRQVIAVVADDPADPATGAASLALHRNRGFAEAGRLSAVGFKRGRWLDTVLLQRSLIPAAGR